MQFDNSNQTAEQKTSLTPDLKEKLMIPNLRALESHIEYESDANPRLAFNKLEKQSISHENVHSEQYLGTNPYRPETVV